MLNKIKRFIESQKLLSRNKLYIVALSGGADSTALLRILSTLGYKVEAAHCNFNLRGAESMRDEEFCKNLCQKLNIAFHLIHFDTYTYAETHKLSIETAARELRYKWFEQLRLDTDAADICVAHHKDDNVETVLMNIIRGTGLNGLCGIRPRNGHIVRPLLCVSREEIIGFLRSLKQDYVTDSTNLVADATRNKIRLKVMPYLKTINSSVSENINLLSKRMVEVEKVVKGNLKPSHSLAEIRNSASPEMMVFALLSPLGFNHKQIEDVTNHISSNDSGQIWCSENYEICLGYNEIEIFEGRDSSRNINLKVPEEGIYVIDDKRKLVVKQAEWTGKEAIPKSPEKIYVDSEKVSFPLTLRNPRQGDRFIPFGMKGSKLVSDFLTDRHFSALKRQSQLLLTDDNGIVWVAGLRIDDRVKITSETKRILSIEIRQG